MSLTNWLVSYWKLDEASWTTAYDSVGSNDWTISGATWTTGKINDWLSFDWVDDYVSIPHNTSLNFGANPFTVSCWVNFNTTNRFHLFNKDWFGSWWWVRDRFDLSTDKYEFRIDDGSNAKEYHFTSNINDWNWHFLSFIRDEQNMIVYIDGSAVSGSFYLNDWTVGTIDNTDILYFGRYSTLATYNWLMDEVWIWNRALTQEEITELYNNWEWLQYPFTQPSLKKWNIFFWFGGGKWEAPEPNPTPVPTAYYTADTGSWTTLFDSVGSNDLTLSNISWTTSWVIWDALDFNWTSSFGSWQLDATSNSMAFWLLIYPDTTPTNNWHILDKWGDTQQFLLRTLDSSSDWMNILFRDDTGATISITWPALTVWAWNFVVWVYDYDNLEAKIYVNWVDESIIVDTVDNPLRQDTTQDLYIWKDSTTSDNYTDWKIDELSFWFWTIPTASDIEWMWNWWDYRRPNLS